MSDDHQDRVAAIRAAAEAKIAERSNGRNINGNGWHETPGDATQFAMDEPPPDDDWRSDEQPPDEPPDNDDGDDSGDPTTWEPVELGPYLRGEITPATPSVGVYRSDGQQLLYPGLEHSVVAHTAAGKTWFALACVTAELLAGHTVAYLHFEESGPASTVERLLRIGIPADTIGKYLMFAAPSRPLRTGWLNPIRDTHPTLVVLDGVNEAMALQGVKIDLEGWSVVRRHIVAPFTERGAAVLECDHLPLSADPLRGDAYGSVHKGNVIDGARFALVRREMFGRGRRGVSHLYSTKDRPGYLASTGKVGGDAVYLGTLVVDDSAAQGADFLTIFAPKPDDGPRDTAPVDTVDAVYEAVAAQPDHEVRSTDLLYAAVRAAGHQIKDKVIRDAAADLVMAGRFIEKSGKRGARGYQAVVSTPARDESE